MSGESEWDKAVKKTLIKSSESFTCKHLILLSRVWDIFQYIFLFLSMNLSCTWSLNKCLMICLCFFLTVWFILHFILCLFIMCDRSLLWHLHLQINWSESLTELSFNSEKNLSSNLNTDLTKTEHLTEEENTNSADFLNNVRAEEVLNRRDSLQVYLYLVRKSSRTPQSTEIENLFKMSFFKDLRFTFFLMTMQNLTAADTDSLHLLQVSLQWGASELLSLAVTLSFDLMMCTQSLNFDLVETFVHLLKETADIFSTAFWWQHVKTAMSSSSSSFLTALSLSSLSWEKCDEDELSSLSLSSASDEDSLSVLNM